MLVYLPRSSHIEVASLHRAPLSTFPFLNFRAKHEVRNIQNGMIKIPFCKFLACENEFQDHYWLL